MDIIGLSQRKEAVTRVMALLRAEVGEEEAEFSLEAAEDGHAAWDSPLLAYCIECPQYMQLNPPSGEFPGPQTPYGGVPPQ